MESIFGGIGILGLCGAGVGLMSAVGVVVLIVMIFVWAGRSAKATEARKAKAFPATATIANVGKSATHDEGGSVSVKLTLNVRPASGVTYPAESTWMIEPAALFRIQPGAVVNILIDADDPYKTWANESWAQSF